MNENQNVLPESPLKISLPNLVYDDSVYEIDIDNQKSQFYRISLVINTDEAPKVLDIFYNKKQILIKNSAIAKERDIDKRCVDVKFDEPLNDEELSNVIVQLINAVKNKKSYYQLRKLLVSQQINRNISSSAKTSKAIGKFATILEIISSIIRIIRSGAVILSFVQDIKQIYSSRESNIDEKLFQNTKLPETVPVISTLIKSIKLFVTNSVNMNSLIVSGEPGVGKTSVVRKVLYDLGYRQGKNYGYISFLPDKVDQFLKFLYHYNDKKLIIIDNIDAMFDDKNYRQLLLQLVEPGENRVINVPDKFEVDHINKQEVLTAIGKGITITKFKVKAKVVLITSKKISEIPNDIRLKSIVVNFDLDTEQVYNIIRINLKDLHESIPINVKEDILLKLYTLLKSYKIKMKFRHFELAVTYYKLYGDNWLEQFKATLAQEK